MTGEFLGGREVNENLILLLNKVILSLSFYHFKSMLNSAVPKDFMGFHERKTSN